MAVGVSWLEEACKRGKEKQTETSHFLGQCGCAPLEVPRTVPRIAGDLGVPKDVMLQKYLAG